MTPVFKVTINGNEYEVNVGDLASSPVEVTVDGVAYIVDLPKDGSALTVRPPAPGRPASPPRPATPPPTAPSAAPAFGSSDDITAPLPGTIIEILVTVGETITAGQGVVKMESMKMEQTIASTRDGTVRATPVSVGDAVAFGQTLVELE